MYPATNSTATATLGSPVVATTAKSPTAANRKNIEFKKQSQIKSSFQQSKMAGQTKNSALIMKRQSQITRNIDPKASTNKTYNPTNYSSGMKSPTRMTYNTNPNATGGKPPMKNSGIKASGLPHYSTRRSSDSALVVP